jgi:hypothetical protein
LGNVVREAHFFALGVETIAASKVLWRAWPVAIGLALGVVHCGRHVRGRSRLFLVRFCLRIRMLLAGAASEKQTCWNEKEGAGRSLSPEIVESEHSSGHFSFRALSTQRGSYPPKIIDEDSLRNDYNRDAEERREGELRVKFGAR